MPEAPPNDDQRLIERHLNGDRNAFREIVERYHGTVCALAYSACGDVARSEDVTQEVFVAAWKQLPQLREPVKLRAWFAAITRNISHNHFRRAQRTPTEKAVELTPETPTEEAGPRERAIGAEEIALMWTALAGIPNTYREAMVLYYREHHSLGVVATALEISEETARQRLSRGRAMLSERMAALVEETLELSAPTPAFAGAVWLTLPGGMGPVIAGNAMIHDGGASQPVASVGSAAAKTGIAIKALAALAALPALFNGVAGYLRFRAQLAAPLGASRSEVISHHVKPLLLNALLMGSFVLAVAAPLGPEWRKWAAVLPVTALIASAIFHYRRRKARDASISAAPACPDYEYQSRQRWLGLPWVHIRVGAGPRPGIVTGWIVLSDRPALAGLFASAPVAVAPFSMGGFAVGLFTVGILAVGFGALGAAAVGNWAAGGLALALQAAQGGLAHAHDFAIGAQVTAAHANDSTARAFFLSHPFFRFSETAWRVAVWAALLGWMPPLLLIVWHLRRAPGDS